MIFMAFAIGLGVVFWMILANHGHWALLEDYRCTAYCENSHKCNHRMIDRAAIQQPVNAWTNLAYIFVGLWPIVMMRIDASTVAYLLSNLYFGISGFVYHASVSLTWQHMDVAGSYTLCICVVLQGVYAVTGISWKLLSVPLLGLAIMFAIVEVDLDETDRGPATMWLAFFGGGCVLGLILATVRLRAILREGLEAKAKRTKILMFILEVASPVVLLAFASLLRAKDIEKTWCNPGYFLQGHALWQCLSAWATLLAWLFYDNNRLPDMISVEPVPELRPDNNVLEETRPPSKVEVVDGADETSELRAQEEGAARHEVESDVTDPLPESPVSDGKEEDTV